MSVIFPIKKDYTTYTCTIWV